VITPAVYDWPGSIVPFTQVFYTGGGAQDGGLTVGGALSRTPEVGGRAVLEASFNAFGGASDPRLLSWLFSKISNGNVFRVPIARSAQLVSAADLGLGAALDRDGVPWDNGEPWDNGMNWAFDPVAEVDVGAAAGAIGATLDLSGLDDEALQPGHLIGHAGRCYVLDTIEYAGGGTADITVSPPWRVAVVAGDLITLRPSMLATVQDPKSFRAPFRPGRIVMPGAIVFTEALI
jgi:hypothetical protein